MKPFLGIVAAVLVLCCLAEVKAGAPIGIRLQRRGRTYVPPKPVTIDSSPIIEPLNKALKALGATDRDYDGHREKAIYHIGAAIRHIETPNAKGRSNAAVEKAADGKPAVATKTATTPQAASDESLRKAKTILFAVHHQIDGHALSKGQLKADADILIAIKEIVDALNPPKTPSTPSTPTTPAPAAATTTATTTPGKPAK